MAAAFVIDASIIIAWYHATEKNEYVDGLLERLEKEQALAPAFCSLEVTNVLLHMQKRCIRSWTENDRALLHLTNVHIRLVDRENCFYMPILMRLISEYGLTAYDAAYLELALREDLPLATLDRKLLEAMTALGVPRA